MVRVSIAGPGAKGEPELGKLGLVEGLAAVLEIFAQREMVLHLLVKPDRDEAAEVDVGVEVPEEHLGRVERRQLGQTDVPEIADPLRGQQARIDIVEWDVGVERPAGALEANEEVVVKHPNQHTFFVTHKAWAMSCTVHARICTQGTTWPS